MKVKSILLAGVLASQGALANLPSVGAVNEQAVPELTHEQLQELLDEGILQWVDGQLSLKDQNALEQLRERGRVELYEAASSSICFRQ